MIVNFEKYHKPPRAAVSSALRKDFDSEPLNWVRLQCDWYRDIDILDLPRSVRSLWPQLLAMAGSSIPHGTAFTSVQRLAKAGNLDEREVADALTFLWKRHKIRYSQAGRRQPTASQLDGHVRTYLRTDERTGDELKNTTKVGGYSSEPMCRCTHPKVVHRGQHHDGKCAAIGCDCGVFFAVAA